MMTSEELRKLDAEIHEKVMGKEVRVQTCQGAKFYWTDESGLMGALRVPTYSSEIAAAWDVLRHMHAKGWLFHVLAMADGFVVNGRRYDMPPDGNWGGAMLTGDFVQEVGDTAPEAICLAALKAVAATTIEPTPAL